MERFFRSLKTEWVPTIGYLTIIETQNHIENYIVGYCSQVSHINLAVAKHRKKAEKLYLEKYLK